MQTTENNLTGGDSRETIRNFFENHSPKGVKESLWLIIIAAFGSKEADYWEPLERANRLLLYRDLCELVEAIEKID